MGTGVLSPGGGGYSN